MLENRTRASSLSRLSKICVSVLLGLAMAACKPLVEPEVKTGRGPGELIPPTVETPAISRSPLPRPDLSALPEGAKGHFPDQDMGQIFVTLPPRQADRVSSEDVASRVIRPILEAMKFQPGMRGLRIKTEAGLDQPRPKLDGVAQLLQAEYTGNEVGVRQHTREMIAAFLGETPPTENVERALQMARGMSFSQFKADIERLEITYPFLQVHGDVPIEHTLLLASRWEGQTVTTVRGTLIHRYSIANRRPETSRGVVQAAYKSLTQVKGIEGIAGETASDGPWLVLLPYGNDANGGISLRYAWRMVIDGRSVGRRVPFLTWVDAQTFEILKMEPLVIDVGARGDAWRRDPGTDTTFSRFFQVDPATDGEYTLQLEDVTQRVDYLNDGFDSDDVAISDSANGSSATLANFDQSPINDAANAICAVDGNISFQQVHFYSIFHVNWQQSISHGIFTPFPTSPWNPRVESATAGCNAWSSMDYGACQGYYDAACPNYSTGGVDAANYMNFAHDNTVVAHELAHNSVDRYTVTRPADWCGATPCPVPLGWGRFHDLADAWADHFENTNCTAGWVAKNLGGVDASRDCQGTRGHVETGGLPRLHEVSVPFNPATPADHFPEHRNAATGEYAEMQMPAAALWQVREGMRSKCRPSGHPQYFVRFTRALKNTGFFGADPGSTDIGDLELQMIEQWATSGQPGGPPAFRHNGNHTTNKVLSGFAKVGIFPIPAQCIDGDAGTTDALMCPGGENGADAVIDIDDNDPADDLDIDGVTHPETDFLELDGPAPTFHVWTGSRFTFSGTSARPVTGIAPCNAKFRVQASTDPGFAPSDTVQSGWLEVDRDTDTADPTECYGTWTPSVGQWNQLQSGGALSKVYYRVHTRDESDGNERLSTEVAGGLWTVPPPYALITADGQSDY